MNPTRSRQTQSLHDSIVKARARQLADKGYSVSADAEGYPKPQEFYGHIPDIVATGVRGLICEVETCDTCFDPRTRDQLRAFSSSADYLLEVVVPEAFYEDAKQQIENIWKITVDFWRTYEEQNGFRPSPAIR